MLAELLLTLVLFVLFMAAVDVYQRWRKLVERIDDIEHREACPSCRMRAIFEWVREHAEAEVAGVGGDDGEHAHAAKERIN